MKRRRFNSFSALSLLMLLLPATMVVVALPWLSFDSDRVLLDVDWYSPRSGGFEWQRNALGVTIYRGQMDRLNSWYISIQYSTLLLLSVPLPLFIYWRHWQRARPDYRRRIGLCPKCGYDLRASKDRCPNAEHPSPFRRQAAGRYKVTDTWTRTTSNAPGLDLPGNSGTISALNGVLCPFCPI